MFNFECYQRGGHVVGTCIDGFLFGACCSLPEGATLPTEAPVGQQGIDENGAGNGQKEEEEEKPVIPEVPAEVDLTGTGLDSVTEGAVMGGEAASPNTGATSTTSTTTEIIVPGIVNVRVPESDDTEDDQTSNASENEGPAQTSTEIQEETTSAKNEDVQEPDSTEDPNVAGPTTPSTNTEDEGTLVAMDDSSNGGDSPDVEESTVKSTDATEADEVSNQMESSVDDQGTPLTSEPLPDTTPPATEPSSKFHSDVETGIPDVLAEGGVITFTIVESAAPTSEGPSADMEEHTEQVIVMTLPDGQDGFATHEIVNFDVTDSLIDGEDNTENPGLMPSSSDELYFEPKPTSHRPYVRPSHGQKTSTSDPLLFWEDEATPPAVDVSAQTIYVLSQTTTDEAEVGTLTTDKPPEQPTVAPEIMQSTESIPLLTPQTTESITEPMLIWTLSPQPSILDAKPPTSVISQVESNTPAAKPEPASKPTADEMETQSDVPGSVASVTPSNPPSSSEKTPASEEGIPDLEDPLAFWTTTRPTRPRPRPTRKPTTTDEPLLIWTTTRTPPQATSTDSSPSDSVTSEDGDPILDSDIPLQPAIIPGDILQHITGDLLHGAQNQTTADVTTTTPWASSTYSIGTIKYEDPSVNTLTDAPQQSTTLANEVTLSSTSQVETATTTKPETTAKTTTERTTEATTTKTRRPTTTTTTKRRRPTTTTTRPTTKKPTRKPPSRRPSTRKPPTRRPTTRRPTSKPPKTTTDPTTEEPISPIDQFIVDFINSSPPEDPMTTTETSPPIDLDLLAQVRKAFVSGPFFYTMYFL